MSGPNCESCGHTHKSCTCQRESDVPKAELPPMSAEMIELQNRILEGSDVLDS